MIAPALFSIIITTNTFFYIYLINYQEMFNKSFLADQIVKSLSEKEFEVFISSGCFDIVAKRESLILIKVLINIDSLNQDQASSLKTVSYFVSAYPLVISIKSNRDFLAKNII